MSCLHRTALMSLVLLLIPIGSQAQQMIFEAAPGVTELGICDYLHNTMTCDEFHISNVPGAVTVGTKLELGGTLYLVEWLGPGYYLESGLVLELLGGKSAGLKNQRWIEVYPKQGRVHTSSSWHDSDRNKRLSVADTLTLEDGRTLRIRDVRLHVRASPVSPK
jgi:hypothetical protein